MCDGGWGSGGKGVCVSVHTWLFDGRAVRMHHTREIRGKRETIRGVETDRPTNWYRSLACMAFSSDCTGGRKKTEKS